MILPIPVAYCVNCFSRSSHFLLWLEPLWSKLELNITNCYNVKIMLDSKKISDTTKKNSFKMFSLPRRKQFWEHLPKIIDVTLSLYDKNDAWLISCSVSFHSSLVWWGLLLQFHASCADSFYSANEMTQYSNNQVANLSLLPILKCLKTAHSYYSLVANSVLIAAFWKFRMYYPDKIYTIIITVTSTGIGRVEQCSFVFRHGCIVDKVFHIKRNHG